uniref:Uncharacterized protein n=1 Tax=Anguilla anguilla TaxID=7936 RepID=A0A0E9VF73_ANGAN
MLHHTSKTKKKKRQNVSLSVTRLVDVVCVDRPRCDRVHCVSK